MRNKLDTFTDFANSLYPHESDFLLSQQQFSKSDNLTILNLVNYNTKNPLNLIPYNQQINKRTYSYLKTWIVEVLNKHDVDLFYDWLISIERNVMNDSIVPEEEKYLLDQTNHLGPTFYYFIRFYQVLQHYRDYLMVRNRIRYYSQISAYLEKYKEPFEKSILLNNDLNSAAERVVSKLASTDEEFNRFEELFKTIYFDTNLDGYTRYRAAVRLTIFYYTNREFDKLRSIYDNLDIALKTNIFYSKRVLANYYANRAMMHSKLNELDLAEKFGYLSIRQKNNDYLFYLVNHSAVLLKCGKHQDALGLMTSSIPELKNTSSYYCKIGFVSFYIRTLLANNQLEKSVSYATTFFEGYKKEIFEYRWHLFFSAYLLALLRNEKYSRIISLSRRYKLVNKEKEHAGKAIYLPVILWYTTISEYMEGEISLEKFKDIIISSARTLINHRYKSLKINELLSDLAFNAPDIIKSIKEELNIN
ncbi:MAG: hypothetical protein HXX16_06470 [Bacteroidales bacterium]|nr:hypothetical protein [Bacteroidales bacterium]